MQTPNDTQVAEVLDLDEDDIDTEALALENAKALQEQINHHLKQLSLERLQTVLDFVAYLDDKESEEATQELLEIPGFVERHAEAQQQIAEGRTVPLEQLKRKY